MKIKSFGLLAISFSVLLQFPIKSISYDVFFGQIEHYTNFLNAPGNAYGQAKIFNENDIIVVFGDYHGDAEAFRNNLYALKNAGFMHSGCSLKLKDNVTVFILGDLVDRGDSITTLSLALGFQEINPGQVFIIKGNHETALVYNYGGMYGGTFKSELEEKWGPEKVDHAAIINLFESLPSVFCVGARTNDGLVNYIELFHAGPGIYGTIKNPIEIDIKPLLEQTYENQFDGTIQTQDFGNKSDMGFIWSDIGGLYDATIDNGRGTNTFLFSQKFIEKNLKSMNIYGQYFVSGIIRGHEHINGNVTKLNLGKWDKLIKAEKINLGSAYTVTSNNSHYNSNGFIALTFDKETGQWNITPYHQNINAMKFVLLDNSTSSAFTSHNNSFSITDLE